MKISRRAFGTAVLALTSLPAWAQGEPGLEIVDVGRGVSLHYLSLGAGVPIVFVHGSLADYSYWHNQLAFFSASHRAIAYSRRFNPPNENPAIRGYSALTDAADLIALTERLKLGPAHIVGHSYGALTALFMGLSRPDLVCTLVLCEPPAMSLLKHITGADAGRGKAMFADVTARMVGPMTAAFRHGDV